jgi:hypothetical protein
LFCFRFAGEPVNLRDQQDSVEFLNTVVDSLDEALKTLNLPQICSKVLGGAFADQKICKDCPHRYLISFLDFFFLFRYLDIHVKKILHC